MGNELHHNLNVFGNGDVLNVQRVAVNEGSVLFLCRSNTELVHNAGGYSGC